MNVALENIHSLISLLDVTDVLEGYTCQRCVQIRKDGTFISLVGGGQCEISDHSHSLKLFIGNRCPKACDDGDDHVDIE